LTIYEIHQVTEYAVVRRFKATAACNWLTEKLLDEKPGLKTVAFGVRKPPKATVVVQDADGRLTTQF
jgi:hypothetical protein